MYLNNNMDHYPRSFETSFVRRPEEKLVYNLITPMFLFKVLILTIIFTETALGAWGEGGYSHILAIWVCAAGKGIIFKPSHQSRIGPCLTGLLSEQKEIVIKDWNQERFSVFHTGIGSQNLQNLLWLVKGRTFANPAAHPHPNYMGVPPPVWEFVLTCFNKKLFTQGGTPVQNDSKVWMTP